MSELISVQQALEKVLSAFKPLPVEEVDLLEADGRVLAENVQAGLDLPRFDYSSMDGFAVNTGAIGNIDQAIQFQVIGDIPAGSFPEFEILPGQAARIMTGAVVPVGATAIVPVEDTDFPYRSLDAQLPEQITVQRSPAKGAFVRLHGSDIQKGQAVFSAGKKLFPQDVEFLAALGIHQVRVYRRARISLFSSGDELASPGEPLLPGQIYDANSYTLAALAKREGAIIEYRGIVKDELEAVRARFDQAAQTQADFILTSAGVSVGAFDYVRKVIQENGRLSLWKVNMRPGKPIVLEVTAASPPSTFPETRSLPS